MLSRTPFFFHLKILIFFVFLQIEFVINVMNMKTLKFLVSVVALCALTVSCTKEGKYGPKKQISKITHTYSYKSEYWDGNSWVVAEEYNGDDGNEVWNWKGKQLESIDYYHEGQLSYTEYFTYEKNRLASINYGGSDHYEFIYEKGKITSIEVYNGSEREAVYAITHEGGKITKIAYTPFGSQSTETHPLPSCVLDLGLPVQKGLNGLNGPKATAYEYEFEWSGKNVKHCTYRSANYIEERFFTYDKMLNPLCGLWEIDGLDFQMMVSKNNVSRVEIHSDNSISIMDYSYSYQGDVPTVATGTSTSSSATDRMTYSLSTIYDYQ